jgi:hypothetical protein
MMFRNRKQKGKILRVQLGYNPNSSSLGVDVSFLLYGSMAIVALTSLASALLNRASVTTGGTRVEKSH